MLARLLPQIPSNCGEDGSKTSVKALLAAPVYDLHGNIKQRRQQGKKEKNYNNIKSFNSV